MPKKENKIILAVSTDERERRAMIQRIAIELGFAITPSDGGRNLNSVSKQLSLYYG